MNEMEPEAFEGELEQFIKAIFEPGKVRLYRNADLFEWASLSSTNLVRSKYHED